MANPFEDIYAAVVTDLSAAATCALYDREKFGNRSPNVFVWQPKEGPIAGAHRIGRNPRHVGSWQLNVDVWCWGADFDTAFAMMEALITSLEKRMNGRNYTVPNCMVGVAEWMHLGIAIVPTVRMLVPIRESVLTSLTPKTSATAEIESTNPVAPDDSAEGDNRLDSGED